MSKERLEEARKVYSYYFSTWNKEESDKYAESFIRYFGEFLIEQAERVKILESRSKRISENAIGLQQQNKRYREQLKLIISDTHCKEHEYVSVRHLIRKRAEKALEDDSNE